MATWLEKLRKINERTKEQEKLAREMTHRPQAPIESLRGQDPLTDWGLGVRERTLSPLATLAGEAKRFQGLSPQDMGMELVGGGMAGTLGKVAGKAAQKTEYELAHELAQRNAALPIEQGGLGLPANNTAIDRAKAMGFDTPAYHGTNADIRAADYAHSGGGADQYGSAALYTATNPTMASGYAKTNIEGGNVLPLMIRSKGFMPSDAPNKLTSKQIENIIKKSPDEYALSNFGDVDYEGKAKVLKRAVDAYKNAGQDEAMDVLHMINSDFYGGNPEIFNQVVGDTLKTRGIVVDVGDKEKFLLPWKPEDIRSRFAAFDPFQRNSANILAGGAAGAVGLSTLAGNQDEYY